ncbi:cilia- and flagella-associated protein 100 isoform X3 [Petromyzon marinus]|uniref:Cilia- and flagella-associated protein 100 isoform X2 n=1 Tax=Petromyzon marinus TaxID=7757 RepID=A0AAJ7X5I9_PETMA|nr:cilia- and flagella-associated protein 100 isoform X2 [Petromyzon marinus]
MSSGRPSRRSAPGEKERAVRVKAGGTGAPSPRGNPFRIPPDVDVLQLRARERERANQERENARGLRVQDKSTFASRVRANQARSRHGGPLHDAGEEEEEGDDAEQGSKLQKGSGASSLGKDPAWTLALTRDRQVEKEGLSEFVSRKREMFLVQYGLSVKREEMRALEQQGAREERALEQAERFLEDDAAMFDEFLKQNDRSAVEAIRVAEMEMKARMEQVAEIKKLTAQIVSAKSEIARQEDLLQEYRLYKRFLEGLAPPEWHQRRRERKRAARAIAAPGEGAVETEGTSPCKPENSKGDGGSSNASQDNSDDSEGEFELPLSSPQELLDLFTELEEQNLSLIQNSQDMEQSLEEARQNIASTNQRLNKETETLNIQVQELRAAIAREEERASDLELRANVFSLGELRQEEQGPRIRTCCPPSARPASHALSSSPLAPSASTAAGTSAGGTQRQGVRRVPGMCGHQRGESGNTADAHERGEPPRGAAGGAGGDATGAGAQCRACQAQGATLAYAGGEGPAAEAAPGGATAPGAGASAG